MTVNNKLFFEILNSKYFEEKLQSISINYSNLKQENFIRNTFLEILNEIYFSNTPNLKAFAEHPRENGRTDLSIINKENQQLYKVELKFQFTKDDKNFTDYERIIKKDFETKKSDLFILIVCRFDIQNKEKFDKEWGITSKLTRYNSKTECWKENIQACFKIFSENTNLKTFEYSFSKPYQINYDFYLLSKNSLLVQD